MAITKDFLGAGKAIFTVANPHGKHYTFKIRKKKDMPYFVSLLTGPDNYANYTYLGIYIPAHAEVRLSTKSRYNAESLPVKVVRWAIKMIHEGKELPEGYSIRHEGKCARCGRRLTDPVSIERGFGPECWRRSVNS